MSDELKRDFKGIWIPKEIWLENELTILEKVIFLEIDSLDVTDEGCYASNEYLAKFCNCTETKVSKAVAKLVKLNYLKITKFDGRKRFLKSNFNFVQGRVEKMTRQTLTKLKADFNKSQDINIINNINNNIDYNIIYYIVDYLNKKTGSHYKSSTSSTRHKIKARLNEGFSLDDFKKVVDKKCAEWIGTEYEKYLRPETLFGTKFESYLNQPTTKKRLKDISLKELEEMENETNRVYNSN